MKLKRLPILYAVYLVLLILIFGAIKVFGVVLTPQIIAGCVIIFLGLTGGTLGITVLTLKEYNRLQLELKSGIPIETKRGTRDELNDYLMIFGQYSVERKPTGKIVGQTTVQIKRLQSKLSNLDKLLDSTFSKTDLTYVTYKESLDSVLKLFIGNLRGIRKRVDVFDYDSWIAGDRSEISQKYLSDIEEMYKQNETILDSMDSLISELVSLDDVADFSLDTINNLIAQTQDYKTVMRDD